MGKICPTYTSNYLVEKLDITMNLELGMLDVLFSPAASLLRRSTIAHLQHLKEPLMDCLTKENCQSLHKLKNFSVKNTL